MANDNLVALVASKCCILAAAAVCAVALALLRHVWLRFLKQDGSTAGRRRSPLLLTHEGIRITENRNVQWPAAAPKFSACGTVGLPRRGTKKKIAMLPVQRRGYHDVPTRRRPPASTMERATRFATPPRYLKGTERDAAASISGSESVVDVLVVGGGVSGLTAAFDLSRPDGGDTVKSVLLTEARDRVGGNISTRTDDEGHLWEDGPNSYQPYDGILEVACDAGLKDDIVLADPSSYRFVWWKGKLRALPASPVDAVLGDFLTLPGKIRAGLGAVGLKPGPPAKEESVKDFVSRNLGVEAFERLIEPFCSGVYAGDPADLSAPAAVGRVQRLEAMGNGSLAAGALQLNIDKAKQKRDGTLPPRDSRLPEVKGQTVGSFRQGLKQLPEALAKAIGEERIRVLWKLRDEGLERDPSTGEYVCTFDTPEGTRVVRARTVLLTSPAYVTANLLRNRVPLAAAKLDRVKYPPVWAVTVVYPTSALRDPGHGKGGPAQGFGQLHPRSQGVRTLGIIYCSSLFPGRCAEGETMLLNYIGGAQDANLYSPSISELSEDEVLAEVHKGCLETVLKPGTPPPKLLGAKFWPRAIPQFSLGHTELMEGVQADLDAAGFQGLFLGGNYTGGVSLGRCVEYGREKGQEIAKHLEETSQQ